LTNCRCPPTNRWIRECDGQAGENDGRRVQRMLSLQILQPATDLCAVTTSNGTSCRPNSTTSICCGFVVQLVVHQIHSKSKQMEQHTETRHQRLDLPVEASLFLPSVRLSVCRSVRSTNDHSDVTPPCDGYESAADDLITSANGYYRRRSSGVPTRSCY